VLCITPVFFPDTVICSSDGHML